MSSPGPIAVASRRPGAGVSSAGQFSALVIPQDEPPLAARICGTQRKKRAKRPISRAVAQFLRWIPAGLAAPVAGGQPKANGGAPLLGRDDERIELHWHPAEAVAEL